MSIRYHVNFLQVAVLFVLMSVTLFGVNQHPKHFFDTINNEPYTRYEYETQGDSKLMSCNLESNESTMSIKIPGINVAFDISKEIENIIEGELPEDGICKNINHHNILSGKFKGSKKITKIITAIKRLFELYYTFDAILGKEITYISPNLVGEFIGKENAGDSFDMGAFAQCEVNSEPIEDMLLSKFCAASADDKNISLSPAAALASYTVDAMGLPTYGGKEASKKNIKKVGKRKYPSGRTGEELFRRSKGAKEDDGGYLLSEAKRDPLGSTAMMYKTFNKPEMVLQTLAVMNFKNVEDNSTRLPATKADSMDMEDEIVQMQSRMSADLKQFGDTLTRRLRAEILDKASLKAYNWKPDKPHLATLAAYSANEKNVTSAFFKSEQSGLKAIYQGIEDEAKARMASEMLIMTADPNYIADPSEARAALIKPSQRNKFRYAALIQQEKNKMLKLKYALEIKRKQQMVDIIKQQAYIRASIFRDELAKHELEHILNKADSSVSLDGKDGGVVAKTPK